jgi:hypothetical protein
MVIQYNTQFYKIPFNPYEIKDQFPIENSIFNDDFKPDIIAGKLKPNVNRKVPTNFIHFIWVGQKPFSQTQFTENLIGINNFFKDKQLVLWGEVFDENTKKFCEENNILLLNHEDLLRDADPDVIKLYNIRKNLFPSNEGARSDILRMLIMEKCGGIYCDVDNDALDTEEELSDLDTLEDFTTSEEGGNDILIAKQPGLPIIRKIFDTMIDYELADYSEIKEIARFNFANFPFKASFLVSRTLVITGPNVLANFSDCFQPIKLFKTNSAKSWINGVAKYISQNPDIFKKEEKDLKELENKIVYSILYEMHCRGRLNIARFQLIFDKCVRYPAMKKNIIDRILKDIKKDQYHEDFLGDPKEFKEVIAAAKEDYAILTKDLQPVDKEMRIEINFIALKKAIKSQNDEMINFYLNNEIEMNLSHSKLAKLLFHSLQNNNFELFEKVIKKYMKNLNSSILETAILELYETKGLKLDDSKHKKMQESFKPYKKLKAKEK